MSEHLRRAIEQLKDKLMNICAVVEDSLRKAVQSVLEHDAPLAKQVIDNDAQVDNLEVDVEEECLKILALHQPVAIDLRFIVTALKINNDLERIGDLAVNIAEQSEVLSSKEKIDVPADLEAMLNKTQTMVRLSIESLVNLDCSVAHKVCLSDDDVDRINAQMFEELQKDIQSEPENTEALIRLLSVSRHLERIADHATNIAEDVIYMVQGRIVRHSNSV